MKQVFALICGTCVILGVQLDPLWFGGAVVAALASIDMIVIGALVLNARADVHAAKRAREVA